MKTPLRLLVTFLLAALLPVDAPAQINSGSNGSDGALSPTSDLVINMANHPDGIYQYSSVNIPAGVTVTFIPNTKNTPVIWLVQGNVTIGGVVDVSGKNGGNSNSSNPVPGLGGPGGYRGGMGGHSATSGQGPGGGLVSFLTGHAGNASYGSAGNYSDIPGSDFRPLPGVIYGNAFLIPLLGGSGGGGMDLDNGSGGGGGGAILIASSGTIVENGIIFSRGGEEAFIDRREAGNGSGGAVRLIASRIMGSGTINAGGANRGGGFGGNGRVRFDTFENVFGGLIQGAVFTQGFQPIIIPAAGQGAQLAVASVGGVAVAASPTGALASPDVIVPGQQANPVAIVVNCANIPLGTAITVNVTPMNGTPVSATATNSAGTLASSTATMSLSLPRGGGLIYAQATTGVVVSSALPAAKGGGSYAETGLTAGGERFTQIEIKAALGGAQQVTYITATGQRYQVK